jgi:hypothetical protein
MKKLTAEDWGKIKREGPARYFIQSEKDGKLKVIFDSDLCVTTKNDEDIIGRIWLKDWDKVEAKVMINGEPKIYSLGNANYSFVREFIRACEINNITPDNLPGCIFEIEKTGPFAQTIVYVGRTEGSKSIEIPSINVSTAIKDIITDLKNNSPELVRKGLTKTDFVKACHVRGHLKESDIEMILPLLEETGILKITGDKVFLL